MSKENKKESDKYLLKNQSNITEKYKRTIKNLKQKTLLTYMSIYVVLGIYWLNILLIYNYDTFHIAARYSKQIDLIAITSLFVSSIILFFIILLLTIILFKLKNKKNRLLRSSLCSILTHIKPIYTKGVKERYFQVGNFLIIIPVFIIILISNIFYIYNSYDMLFDYGYGLCYAICIIPMLLSPIMIFFLCVTLYVRKVECIGGELITYIGPKSLFKSFKFTGKTYTEKSIKSIRPIPASLYFDLFPGLQMNNGKIKKVKTAVMIEKTDGKMETVLTSRPMEIVSLMRKGED